MADLAPGQVDEQNLRDGGFNDQEISDWKSKTADTLSQGGFNDQEIADHFGVKQPDVSAMRSMVKGNLKTYAAGKEGREPVDTALKPVKAQDWQDALAAGWGMSSGGLDLDKGKSP